MKDINYDITDYEVIHHCGNYRAYFEKMKARVGPFQLRYPATTSLNGENSAIMRILNSHNKSYLLLKPYFFYGSHKIKLLTRDVNQTLDEMVRKGLQKEVALLVKRMSEVGFIDVKNTNKLVENPVHRKHLVSIDDYDFYPYRQYRPDFFNVGPVWVACYLEDRIFKETSIVNGEEKHHPQLQCYEAFNEKSQNNFFKL